MDNGLNDPYIEMRGNHLLVYLWGFPVRRYLYTHIGGTFDHKPIYGWVEYAGQVYQ